MLQQRDIVGGGRGGGGGNKHALGQDWDGGANKQ